MEELGGVDRQEIVVKQVDRQRRERRVLMQVDRPC
jgi:hypothetical protein